MNHLFVILCLIVVVHSERAVNLPSPSNFTELAAKYGHRAVEYEVITEDGYILQLFRIKGERKVPILLMHGILDSADTWTLRGNTSLAITLANKGYDVWVGNCRGNKYGRRHVYLDPNANDVFWDYSFHEHGYYDLPALIDTVLNFTGAPKLDAVGHSQGATIFFVLGSTRPEYNDKVNVLVALAPVSYLQNVEPPLKTIIQYSPVIYTSASILNIKEVFGVAGPQLALNAICQQPIIGYSMCVTNTLFPFTGYDEEELEPNIVPILYDHYPMATSVQNLYHFAQVSYRRTFARFDYGPKVNFDKYGSPTPLIYPLDKVTMRVALFVGANDKVATIQDVALLKQRLPNLLRHMIMPHWKMNHVDFVWGLHMYEYLFPYIFQVLTLVDED